MRRGIIQYLVALAYTKGYNIFMKNCISNEKVIKSRKSLNPLALVGIMIAFNFVAYLIFVLSLRIDITFMGAVADMFAIGLLFFVVNLLPSARSRKWIFLALTLAFNTVYVIDITYFYQFKSFASISSIKFAHNVVGQSFGIKVPWPGIFIIAFFVVLTVLMIIMRIRTEDIKADKFKVRVSTFAAFLIVILSINIPAAILSSRAAQAYDDFEVDYIHSESYLYNKMYSSRKYVENFGYCSFRIRDAFYIPEGVLSEREDIEQFFDGRSTEKAANAMTGVLKGSNLITILGETFDQRYTDPDFIGERLALLTAPNVKAPLPADIMGHAFASMVSPNLYKMRNEAYVFDNYYVPTFFEGATINSEFMAFNAQYALSATKNYTANFGDTFFSNYFGDYSLPGQLKNNGYSTYYIHNDSETFYNRGTLTYNEGFDNRYFDEDLQAAGTKAERIYDTRLIEFFDLFEDRLVADDNFYLNIDTYSMHAGSENKYLNHMPQVERAFERVGVNIKSVDKAILSYYTKIVEFDNFLGMLLEKLDSLGLSDNTAVMLFPDHYYYALTPSIMQTYLGVDPLSYEVHHNKLMLLSPKLGAAKDDTLASTIDITPTLLNMLVGTGGASYRYFMGEDIFDSGEKFVAFSDLTVFDGTTYLTATGALTVEGKSYNPATGSLNIDTSGLVNFQVDVIKEYEVSKSMLTLDFFRLLNPTAPYPPVSTHTNP